MFKAIRSSARSAALLGVSAALVVAGVAVAQGESQEGPPQGGGPKPGRHIPPPGGPPVKGLTYAEFHVQRDGEAQVIRLDQGKIVSADAESITLEENDGGEVTISLDADTKVLAGPHRDATVDDLSTGQMVVVCGPEGGAAKSVAVLPKRGEGPQQGPPEGEGQGQGPNGSGAPPQPGS